MGLPRLWAVVMHIHHLSESKVKPRLAVTLVALIKLPLPWSKLCSLRSACTLKILDKPLSGLALVSGNSSRARHFKWRRKESLRILAERKIVLQSYLERSLLDLLEFLNFQKREMLTFLQCLSLQLSRQWVLQMQSTLQLELQEILLDHEWAVREGKFSPETQITWWYSLSWTWHLTLLTRKNMFLS